MARRLLLVFSAVGGSALLRPSLVLITTFPPEYAPWRDRLPLGERLPFPTGAGNTELGWNSTLGILGVVTGMTSKNAAMSIMALGLDERFDLSRAYWLLAGIAGVDPRVGTVGSAFWQERLVDGTATRFVDSREMPQSWPTGLLPLSRERPYGLPKPSAAESAEMVHVLDKDFVAWAWGLTANTTLPDSPELQRQRQDYASFGAAGELPVVHRGDSLSTDIFWLGQLSTSWARNWTTYWTQDGVFSTSCMEDFAVASSLRALARAGRAQSPFSALLVLRAVSNFVEPPPGEAASRYLEEGRKRLLVEPACEAAFQAAVPVALALASREHEVTLYS